MGTNPRDVRFALIAGPRWSAHCHDRSVGHAIGQLHVSGFFSSASSATQ
jgi:hypothetical protein